MSGLTVLLTLDRLLDLLDGQFALPVHTHGLADVDQLVTSLAAKLNLSGGTLSGPIITPVGSLANCAVGVGGANHGLYNELAGASGAVWIVHNGTGIARARFDSMQFSVMVTPATNGNVQLGSSSLAWSAVTSNQFRSGPGSASVPGYLFNISGSAVPSGMYAISTTTLGLTLNGTSCATFTSSGLTLQTGTFLPTAYITATLPSASANTAECATPTTH